MEPLKIKIIVGSTRQGRFSEKPAAWIRDLAAQRKDLSVEMLDLREYDLPFFDQPMSPAMGGNASATGIVKKWLDKIAEADAYIIIAPEYNHGYPGVLKNALDWAYDEWNNKPVGFVSYGGVGGARSVEQLRLVAVELQMAPIRNAVHIFMDTYMQVVDAKNPVGLETFDSLNTKARDLLEQLVWWAGALRTARKAG